MGSSGSGTSYKVEEQEAADTLSLSDIYDEANEAASEQLQDRIDAIKEYYPEISDMALDTADKISETVAGSQDYLDSRSALADSKTAISDMKTGEDAIGRLGAAVATEADKALAQTGATSIEAELYRQGEEDLALGRSLSAEQIRQAQQTARSAYTARGLGSSLAGAAAEVLNRDAYAQNRQDARRSFAAYANNLREQNTMSRRDQAAALAGQSGNLYANQSSIAGNRASLNQSLSSAYTNINPYRFGYSVGSSYVSPVLSAISDTTNSTYDTATDTSSSVASFNANMLDTRYNNYLNNSASIASANAYSNASSNSGIYSLIGSGTSALSGIASSAILGSALASDRRDKKDIKPIGSAGKVLGLTAYEFKYKGDDKKRVGFMAQDVKRVLPEAVRTVKRNGKKRLVIKPQVIGAAIARELTAQASK